jgi:hypothetical protein
MLPPALPHIDFPISFDEQGFREQVADGRRALLDDQDRGTTLGESASNFVSMAPLNLGYATSAMIYQQFSRNNQQARMLDTDALTDGGSGSSSQADQKPAGSGRGVAGGIAARRGGSWPCSRGGRRICNASTAQTG